MAKGQRQEIQHRSGQNRSLGKLGGGPPGEHAGRFRQRAAVGRRERLARRFQPRGLRGRLLRALGLPGHRAVKDEYHNAYNAVSKLLGGPIEEKDEIARNASPVTYVSKDAAAFLIGHGTHDTTVPPPQADALYAALKKAGADVTFIKILDGGHNVAGGGGAELLERVQAFFDKHLLGKDTTVSDQPIQAQTAAKAKP